MPDIYVVDNLSPEATAMLQALKSRSSEPARKYVNRCVTEGPEFMKKWYVGYNHGSIGQCGTTTLFIERVSILVAKAIQDNRLYNGQETSTRYIDCSDAYMHDPIRSDETQAVINAWMGFYRKALHYTTIQLMKENPVGDIPLAQYTRTIQAKAFDTVRGFLPAALSTQLSWTGNFDNMNNHIAWLRTHPLAEVRDVASTMLHALKKSYPNSFSQVDNQDMMDYYSQTEHYFKPEPTLFQDTPLFVSNLDKVSIAKAHTTQLAHRPRHVRLPATLSKYGTYTGRFTLDYGSFRDIQRHRGGRCEMPILNTDYGFHEWYIDTLPEVIQEEARTLVAKQTIAIKELAEVHGEEIAQYLCVLGYRVPVEIEYDLPQMVYVAELRSGQTVHATLREVAIKMLETVQYDFPQLKLYGDTTRTEITYRRGTQTIITAV